MIILATSNATVDYPGLKFRWRFEAARNFMAYDFGCIKMETLIHKMIVANRRWYWRGLLVGIIAVIQG